MGGFERVRRTRRRVLCLVVFVFVLVSDVEAEMKMVKNKERVVSNGGDDDSSCDIYEGKWVFDPLLESVYDSKTCPHIRREFDCQRFGRQDQLFLKFKWQPSNNCSLPKFNGEDFLTRFQGKKIMFVGDSLSLNIWQSLICLLHAAAPLSNTTTNASDTTTSVTFEDYGVTVSLFHSLFLVDVETEEFGRVLKLNSIKNGATWKDNDVLVFNTWLWWGRRGAKQPWDYVQLGNKVYRDMDRMAAFQLALTTWGKWVGTEVDSVKTKVFYQGINPSHYFGQEWGEPAVKTCANQTLPLSGEIYPSGLPEATKIVDNVLSRISTVNVTLLNITTLSQLRKDAHPSSHNEFKGMDCTHWCIPGLPDTWNQLLYAELIKSSP